MSSPAERPRAKSLNPLLALRPFLRPYWPMILGGVFALLIAAGAQLALPVALRQLIDHVFAERYYPAIHAGTRVSNPASRRVLEKCGFQWTGVGLYRIRAINSSAPLDRFRLERAIWSSLKSWGTVRRSGKFKRAEG